MSEFLRWLRAVLTGTPYVQQSGGLRPPRVLNGGCGATWRITREHVCNHHSGTTHWAWTNPDGGDRPTYAWAEGGSFGLPIITEGGAVR